VYKPIILKWNINSMNILKLFFDDDLNEETNEIEEETNSQLKLKVKTKGNFYMKWLKKFDWFDYVKHNEK